MHCDPEYVSARNDYEFWVTNRSRKPVYDRSKLSCSPDLPRAATASKRKVVMIFVCLFISLYSLFQQWKDYGGALGLSQAEAKLFREVALLGGCPVPHNCPIIHCFTKDITSRLWEKFKKKKNSYKSLFSSPEAPGLLRDETEKQVTAYYHVLMSWSCLIN